MKAVLDHVGIAVKDLAAALAFYRDALGLDVEGAEDVASQRVRAHFVPVGGAALELLEATAPDSPIAKYVEKRGPGLHHITLRVEDIDAALAQLKARGVRLIDEQPRPGAEHALVAFIHPSAAHGVLVELKQAAVAGRQSSVRRFALGDFELVSVCDGFFHLDGGAMFGVVPKPLWSATDAGRRQEPHHAGHASAHRPRRAHDDHRRRAGGQGEREVRGDLRRRPRAQSGSFPRRGWPLARGRRHRARHAPALRPRRRVHDARRVGPRPSALSARAVRRPARRVGGRDASARAQQGELLRGQLRAARRRRRAAARRRGPDHHARRAGPADRRPHDASSDGRRSNRAGRPRPSSPT